MLLRQDSASLFPVCRKNNQVGSILHNFKIGVAINVANSYKNIDVCNI